MGSPIECREGRGPLRWAFSLWTDSRDELLAPPSLRLTGPAGQLAASSIPVVPHVRRALFIVTVGHREGDEAMALIETSSGDVRLKRPEVQAARALGFCDIDRHEPSPLPTSEGST
jgi:hypothetical protein